MPGFSDQTIEEIRARCDIVDIVSQRVPLKRAGADFKACCPFHREKTPSFIVSPSRRSFHCFGCGAQGDVFKFLMLSDGMTFPDAVKALAERCGVTLEEEKDSAASRLRKRLMALHEDIAAFYRRCLEQLNSAQHARDYLAKRRLDKETVEKFRIGYAPTKRGVLLEWAAKHGYSAEEMVEAGFLSPPRSAGDSFYDKFAGRLMFPICDQNGHVVAFSGRILDESQRGPKYYNSTETPIFRKSRILYGLCFAKRAITKDVRRRALVCEGQIDVIRCHSCGFATAVASQGTAFTADHVSLLKPYADGAILAFDGDGAGMKAAIRTGRLFLAAGLPAQAAVLPPGEDPDSFLRDRPAQDFQDLIDNPVSLVELHVRAYRASSQTGAIDSLDRLTAELFETIASASKAVFRSYMLQEASELLKLPEQALEDDFAAFLASRERREASHRQREAPETPETPESPDSPGNPAPQVPQVPQVSPASPASQARLRIPETPLLAIADILVKMSASPSDESKAVALEVSDWLPPMAPAGNARLGIVHAAIRDIIEGTNELSALAESGSDEERTLIAYLATRPSPILQSEMATVDALHDLLFRVWVDYVKEARDAVDSSAEDGPRRRLLLSTALRRLESAPDWKAQSGLIAQYR